jgi:hypothetical protein
MTRPIPVALHHTCFLVRDVEITAQAMADALGTGPWNVWTIEPTECFLRPSTGARGIGSFVEVLYLDAAQLPAPELVIQPSS